MTINEAIIHLGNVYQKYRNEPYVRKPISFALYQTWKWADAREKKRDEVVEDGNVT